MQASHRRLRFLDCCPLDSSVWAQKIVQVKLGWPNNSHVLHGESCLINREAIVRLDDAPRIRRLSPLMQSHDRTISRIQVSVLYGGQANIYDYPTHPGAFRIQFIGAAYQSIIRVTKPWGSSVSKDTERRYATRWIICRIGHNCVLLTITTA